MSAVQSKESKHFFFVNKKEAKKTSIICSVLVKPPIPQFKKSFWALFTKSAAFL
jgi:hypothetical protein